MLLQQSLELIIFFFLELSIFLIFHIFHCCYCFEEETVVVHPFYNFPSSIFTSIYDDGRGTSLGRKRQIVTVSSSESGAQIFTGGKGTIED